MKIKFKIGYLIDKNVVLTGMMGVGKQQLAKI